MQGATIHRAETDRTLTEADVAYHWTGTTIPCPHCDGRVRWESAACGETCPNCDVRLSLTVTADGE